MRGPQVFTASGLSPCCWAWKLRTRFSLVAFSRAPSRPALGSLLQTRAQQGFSSGAQSWSAWGRSARAHCMRRALGVCK